jgi:hypothetical protein
LSKNKKKEEDSKSNNTGTYILDIQEKVHSAAKAHSTFIQLVPTLTIEKGKRF